MDELKSCPFCGGEIEERGGQCNYGKKTMTLDLKCKQCETIFKFKSKWNENPYQEAVAAFNRRTNVNETPISPTSKWCDNQSVDELGKVICLAHLAEARVPDCPYKSKEERASANPEPIVMSEDIRGRRIGGVLIDNAEEIIRAYAAEHFNAPVIAYTITVDGDGDSA